MKGIEVFDDATIIRDENYSEEHLPMRKSIADFKKYLEERYEKKILVKQFEKVKVIPEEETIIVGYADLRCMNEICSLHKENTKYSLYGSVAKRDIICLPSQGAPLAVSVMFYEVVPPSMYERICLEIEELYGRMKSLYYSNKESKTYKFDSTWAKYQVPAVDLMDRLIKIKDVEENKEARKKIIMEMCDNDEAFRAETGITSLLIYGSNNKFLFL